MKNAVNGFSVKRAGDTVSVAGTLTITTASAVLAAASECFDVDSRLLNVDLSGLQQVDSSALAVLLEWLRRAARSDQQLAFRDVPERLKQLAQISELEDVLGFNVG